MSLYREEGKEGIVCTEVVLAKIFRCSVRTSWVASCSIVYSIGRLVYRCYTMNELLKQSNIY